MNDWAMLSSGCRESSRDYDCDDGYDGPEYDSYWDYYDYEEVED